ncbi:MAG: hypothetical protein ACYTBP_05145 [Planctomycetota bacterium]|jgi:hypothetical protein
MRPTDDLKKLINKSHLTVSRDVDNRILGDAISDLEQLKQTQSARPMPNMWRVIMKKSITKLAIATVIIIVAIFVINQFGGSIDGSSIAWAEIVQRVERSHDEYHSELLAAMEEMDIEKIGLNADLLSEFWQKLGWLARAELDPKLKAQMSAMIAEEKAGLDDRRGSEETGIKIFIAYSDQFSDWLSKIADQAWLNETIHVCKQMEEYAEEIRDAQRYPELDLSYAEHCMPSFVTYCEWFRQLPWDDPEQVMTPAMLLAAIERDLNIAWSEIETREIRGVIRFVERSVEQARINILDLEKKTASSSTEEQRNLCRKLTRRIEELWTLIQYAKTKRQDFIEELISRKQYNNRERYIQVLTEDFGENGSFADYYIDRINQSLDLCEQLLALLESVQ